MLKTLAHMWYITKKDLLEFRRDNIRLITFAIMPIFMMVLVGFIFPSQNSLRNIPIGIADMDNQSVSQKMISAVEDLTLSNHSRVFKVNNYSSIDAIKDGIKKQEISGGLAIPSDFTQKLTSNQQATITIVQDQSNPQISALTTQVLDQVINGFSQQIGLQRAPIATLQPIIIKLEGIIPGNPNYFEFVAPGIMAMVVLTAVLTGLASSVSREKEQGTLDGVLIAPISRMSIILGKAMAQSIRGLIQGIIVLLLAIFIFGVSVHGNLLLVALLLLLGIFSFVGLGILVSAIAAEQETATQLLFMFQFPMLFLSGAFFPLQQMPKIMQQIAHILPLTYAVEALRKVMVLGAGIGAVYNELIVLLAFGVATLIIAVPIFKRMVTR